MQINLEVSSTLFIMFVVGLSCIIAGATRLQCKIAGDKKKDSAVNQTILGVAILFTLMAGIVILLGNKYMK